MKILKYILLLLILIPSPSWASVANVYIAQTAAGSGDGSSCGNAKAYSFFNDAGNWGAGAAQIGPDTIVHICGTLTIPAGTTALVFYGSGTSGYPITLKWEAGAKIATPYGPDRNNGGIVNTNGKNYLVIDGNSTNPSITNTNNGTAGGYTYQQETTGIYIIGSNNVEVKNITIDPLYVRTSTTDYAAAGNGIEAWTSSNVSIHHNSVNWMFVGIQIYAASAQSNVSIYNNTLNNTNWHVRLNGQDGGPNYLDGVYIYNNTFLDNVTWDCPIDVQCGLYHHNGVVFWNWVRNIYIYNNLFGGDRGYHCTASIYGNDHIERLYIYNNVFLNLGDTVTKSCPNISYGWWGDNTFYIVNNYIDSGGWGETIRGGTIDGLTIKNNIFAGGNYNTFNNLTNYTSDYNAFTSGAQKLDYPPFNEGTNSFQTAGVVVDSTYHPLQGSGVIDTGQNLSSLGIPGFNVDKAGLSRPQGSGWDMGPYEFTGEDVTPPVISNPLPSGVQQCDAASPVDKTLAATSNENATGRYGLAGENDLHDPPQAVTANTTYDYLPHIFGTTGALSHSQVISLACGNGGPASYTFYSRYMDASPAHNKNLTSTVHSFSIDPAVGDVTAPIMSGAGPATGSSLVCTANPRPTLLQVTASDETQTVVAKYHTSDVVFDSMSGTFGTKVGDNFSHLVNLACGQTVTFHYRAADGVTPTPNKSPSSLSTTFTILGPITPGVIQAESGTIVAPMVAVVDAGADGGYYIHSTVDYAEYGIPNGDFESGFTGGLANSWSQQNDGGTYTFSQDTGYAGSAQKLVVTTVSSWGIFFYQMPAFIANQYYTWSFWYKNTTGGSLWAEISNDNGSQTNTSEQLADTAGAWVYKTINFQYTNTLADELRFYSATVGSYWVDGLTLTSNSGKATFTVAVATTGTYRIGARGYSIDTGGNSLKLKVDVLDEITWDLGSTYNAWFIDFVNSFGVADPYQVYLTAGNHTFIFRGREKNTRLDYFYLESVDIPPQPPMPQGLMIVGSGGPFIIGSGGGGGIGTMRIE